jgi:hypothetical protein
MGRWLLLPPFFLGVTLGWAFLIWESSLVCG